MHAHKQTKKQILEKVFRPSGSLMVLLPWRSPPSDTCVWLRRWLLKPFCPTKLRCTRIGKNDRTNTATLRADRDGRFLFSLLSFLGEQGRQQDWTSCVVFSRTLRMRVKKKTFNEVFLILKKLARVCECVSSRPCADVSRENKPINQCLDEDRGVGRRAAGCGGHPEKTMC